MIRTLDFKAHLLLAILFALCTATVLAKGDKEELLLTPNEQAWLAKHQSIKLGFNPHMEPLLIKENDGSLRGVYPEIFKELEEILYIDITIEIGEWSTIVQKTRSRDLDGLLACAPSQAKASDLLKTEPLHYSYPVVYAPYDVSFTINSLDDLKGKRIAYQKEVSMLEVVLAPYKKTCEVIAVGSTLEALGLVLDGRADVALGVNFENYLVAKHSLSGIKIAYYDLAHSNPISTGIRNDWPELVEILNKGMDHIGFPKLQAILSNYTNISELQKTPDLTTNERNWLKEHPVITVGCDVAWAPIEYMDNNGQFKGLAIDYLRTIEGMLGVRFEIDNERSWQRVIEKVKDGKIDLLTNVSVTPEREKFLNFSDSYSSFPILIYTLDNVSFIPDMRHLKGKKVAVVKDYAIQGWLERDYPDLELVICDNIEDSLDRLINGEAFAYLGNIVTTGYYIGNHAHTNIKVAGETEYTYDGSMAVRKDWPIFSGIIQKALDGIPDEKRIAINRKWISIQYEHGFDYTPLWWSLAAIFVVFAAIFYWNRQLKRLVGIRTSELTQSNERLKANEKERKKLIRQLKSKNEELQDIVYASSHDLKTPLVNIKGFSDMLIMHSKQLYDIIENGNIDAEIKKKLTSVINNEIQEDLDIILTSSDRMKSLIDGLLKVSRIGTTEVNFNNIDMNNVISEIFENVKYLTDVNQTVINIEELPDCRADEDMIKQVFANLVDNAIKYFKPEQKGMITIKGYNEDDRSIYCVEDNGIGIKNGYQTKIFEIYHRLDPTDHNEGEGLGLTIIRRIMDRHNGKVWLESEEGKGSKFFVSLSQGENICPPIP